MKKNTERMGNAVLKQVHFIYYIASRYFKSRRQDRRIAFSLLSVTGIAFGVMTLLTVLGVMNGFQMGFKKPILEVNSYHIQIFSDTDASLPDDVLEEIKKIDRIRAVIPFMEVQVIINPDSDNRNPCFIRAVPDDAAERDEGFRSAFRPEYDIPSVSLLAPDDVIIGSVLAGSLNVVQGEKVSVFTISSSSFSSLSPAGRELTVAGIFKTGFYQMDSSWAFVSLSTAFSLTGEDSALRYGVKLKNMDEDRLVLRMIEEKLEGTNFKAESWRTFNRSFFGALQTEKLMMMFLVGLIFIVVAFNIFHSLRRSVYERLEEIGTLKALGATTGSIRNIFILEGFMIGFMGSMIGIIGGFLISKNINSIFDFTESVVNRAIYPPVEFFVRFFDRDFFIQPLSIFSRKIFYIDIIMSYSFFEEVLFIFLFAILSSTAAAFTASHSVSRIKPAVLMRSN